MTRKLIKNATIVTLDPNLGVVDDCDLLIDDGLIAELRPALNIPDAARIDARNMIAMPGLINAHIHTWETVLRGIGAEWVNDEYFDALLGRLAAHFTPEDMYLSTLAGALNQLDGGCTTILDWCHNTATPDHTDMAIRALEDSGTLP